ncbi:SgcJ/EcaC family oxidoreductase [Neolewinella persica]|uniref:SgcJ/EcaC family oxidoreductase n=1 Tax=Neolewinella persica TaxID=70998 RepID=UPI0003A8AAD8|nr:SgcJ/EcaC family oxidoreductase [Neolewinella persica]
MKNLFYLILLLSLFIPASLLAQMEDPALLMVKQSVRDFFDYNGKAYSNAYASEGVLVNPMGEVMQSPEAIHASHVPLFTQYWKGISSEPTFLSSSVRYLEDNLAIVQLKVETVQTKAGQEVDRFTQVASGVVRRSDSGWKLELFQVTTVQSMPEE